MSQTFFHKLQLAVSAAEHRHVGEGPHRPLVVQSLGLQHIHAARHSGDLLSDEYPLRKAILGLDQPHCGPGGAMGDDDPLRAGIMGNHIDGSR